MQGRARLAGHECEWLDLDESRAEEPTYFYLEEVLRWSINLLEALLTRIWHGLHGCEL
jgi:hypothetical protein